MLIIAEPLAACLIQKSPQERKNLLKTLFEHEKDEWTALNDETDPLYRDLGRFIEWFNKKNGQIAVELLNRDSGAFHEYIDYLANSKNSINRDFGIEHKEFIGRAPPQAALLKFAQKQRTLRRSTRSAGHPATKYCWRIILMIWRTVTENYSSV